MHRSVVIVGAGHAGIEAAFAAARVGVDVVVVTGCMATIGQTPCNPSVGGVAKGHLVKEVDALGGFMGRAADACAIHGRVLNRSKGPAVRSTRVQVDKQRYGAYASEALLGSPGIRVHEGLVTGLRVDRDARCTGVQLGDGSIVEAGAVVVTTGTFLRGLLHTGTHVTPGGRVGEAPANALSEQLAMLGFELKRLKTGTPPRLDGRTIDWSRLEPQASETPLPKFCLPDEAPPTELARVDCHLTWTNARTHDLVMKHLHASPMYSGQILGRGPRYCPSLEDKVVRFAHRDRHQVFVEPEGLDTHSVYPNGISTSLPAEVQAEFVATIDGLERAVVLRPGYAVEYDAVDARALRHDLASKDLAGLYFAGQLNGTSGYEEAAIQGLLAGANAALSLCEREPLVLARHEAYGGVLVDDLVTQGCDEPYRMFTSRAEYRMRLREDNADVRLAGKAFAAGLITRARFDRIERRKHELTRVCEQLRRGEDSDAEVWVVERARHELVYVGYADRLERELDRIRGEGVQDLPLDPNLDYLRLSGLTREAAERLARVRPMSTGQAARIPGITPAALMCVWAHAKQRARASSRP